VNKDAWRDLEESVLEVTMVTGQSMDAVLDMDALSFFALGEVVTRVERRHKYEDAWTAMMAAQGTKEGMSKLTKQWEPKPDPVEGTDRFLAVLNAAGVAGGF
jgi:hypothetical protein